MLEDLQENTEEVELPYLWYSEEEWKHIEFILYSQLNAIMKPLRGYGQGVYVDGAIKEIMELFDLFSQKIRGKDIPVMVRASPAPSEFDS